MFDLFKKLFASSLIVIGIIGNSALAQVDDSLWQTTTGLDAIFDTKVFDDAIYLTAYKDCENNCVPTIQKISMDGDFLWERQPSQFVEESETFLEVNEHGVFVVGEMFMLKYSYDGDLVWEKDFAPLVFPLGSTRQIIGGVISDENGLYLEIWGDLGFGSSYDTQESALIGMDFDGNLNWLTYPTELDTTITTFTVSDGVIYSVTRDGVYRHSTSGEFLSSSPYEQELYGRIDHITLTDDAIYGHGTFANSVERLRSVRLYKFNLYGELVWKKDLFDTVAHDSPYYKTLGLVAGVASKGADIFVGKYVNSNALAWDYSTLIVERYNSEGMLLEQQSPVLPNEASTSDGNNFIISDERFFVFTADSSDPLYLRMVSEFNYVGTPVSPEPSVNKVTELNYLGDINSDGYRDIAVVTEGDEVAVSIESIGTDANLNSVVFDAITSVADVKVISDQNDNGAAEIALISEADSKVVIRDSLTGELINEVTFNSNVSPIKINFVADLNNNGSAEVALFGSFTNGNGKVVMVKDSASGELLHTVYFNPNFAPKDFAFVADINGDAAPEVAVLSTDSNNTSKFEIRSLNGEMIKNIWLGKAYNSTELVTLPVATDSEPTLATALGALQTKVNGNGLTVRMMDTQSGAEIQSVNYNSNFNPITAKAISDINNNGTPEVAVLGSNTDTTTGETSTKIEVKDSYSANLVKNIWQNKTVTPIDLTVVVDINGNGSPETVTLVEQNDSYKAIVKDSLTGELLDAVAVEIE